MADEEEVSTAEAPPEEEQQEPGPGPGPSLSDADKAKLVGIIKRMEAAKEPEENIKGVVKRFSERFGAQQSALPTPPDYRQPVRQERPVEVGSNPAAQLQSAVGVTQDPAIAARQKEYQVKRDQAIKEVEGPDWKDLIFTGAKPALTTNPNMPVEAFQKVDTKAMENYLDTKDLSTRDRYWLRNQILNYGEQRHSQYYIEQRAQDKVSEIPEVKKAQDAANAMVLEGKISPQDYDATWKATVAQHPETANQINNAYTAASVQYQKHLTEAIANKLNNVGLDDKPLRSNAPFHDQITGVNKALMGAINFAGDIGHQASSLLELGNIPGLSDLGYKLKTDADNLKARNEIPQTGDAGNLLAGEILPMALDMEALRRFSGAAGKPIYQALGKARASGAMGQFAEGAIGGLAISPANSYIIAHQYYNDLVKQGVDPATAAGKSDQLLVKNIATDLLMTPMQMGLMKVGGGDWQRKALMIPAEGVLSGTHFTLQDFNQKSTENPALTVMDYLSKDPDVGKTFISGAALGMLQKAAVDQMHNWDAHSDTKNMFSYGRQYNSGDNKLLPGNKVIANNILSAMEMKDTPGRPQELKDLTNSLEESGVYNKKEAENVRQIIDDVVAVKAKVPKFGRPEQRIAVMNELLEQHAAERFSENAGHEAAGGPIDEKVKESDERIKRIMAGQEPLYFINGNETNREQLLAAVEKDPSLVGSKGAKIKILNDAATINKLKDFKTEYDVVQVKKSTANDVRNTSGNSQTVGGRDESQGAIDQSTSGEENAAVPQAGNYLESRHGDTEHDEAKKVSGQDNAGLSAKGKVDAQALAEEVAADHDVTKVISSDLARASETARIVADHTGAAHEERPDLRSWDLGDFRGMDENEFKKAQKHFVDYPEATEFEGKKLGESFNQYKDRVIKAQEDLQSEGPSTMVINHSNNMNIWDAYSAHGKVWDENTAQDYLSRKSPEPATLRSRPGEEEIPGTAEKMAPDDLINLFKKAIDETKQSIQSIRESNERETGNREANGEDGRQREKTDNEERVSPDSGAKADEPNKGAEPLSSDRSSTDAAGVTHEAGLPDPVTKAFIEHDVKPALQKISEGFKNAFDIIRKAFDPRAGVEEKALTAIMKALGDRNKYEAVLDGALKSMEKMFDKMKDQDRINFIDRMKTGKPQGSKELQAIADMLKYMDKGLYKQITQYKPSLSWKENHFRVLWKVIPGSTKTKNWNPLIRRPFQGSRGFMKRATLEDMTEGINMGGVPESTNPITMFKLAYADGMKYVTAQRMFEALKNDKFAKFVRKSAKPPDGWVPMDDNLTKVYFKVPEGLVNMGEYYMDPGAGRLLNNHLSRDLIREGAAGKGLMWIKNAYTATELGLSGFHAVAEGLEAISSQIGIGLRKMFNLGIAGRDLKAFTSGVKDIVTSPGAFVTTASLGKKAMNYTTSEEFRKSKEGQSFLKAFPDAHQYIDDFFKGGGLMKQHEDLKLKTLNMFKEQAGKDNYIGATIRAVPAINEMVMDPLFNTFIPRLKVGMFFKEFPVRLQENATKLANGKVTRQELARQTIDFVDDRLGEMNFDNLFWNRTLKTAQQFFLRSVTWKLGNLRAMGGVLPEIAKEVYTTAKGEGPFRLPPKAAWLLGLSVMQVALSTVLQKMLSGKDIEGGKDIVAPQINADDPNERVIMPTYFKDMLHLYHSPLKYVTTSMAGQLSKVYDVWNNRDFYGYEIRDEHGSTAEQAKQSLLYIAPKPFSISSYKAMDEKGEPMSKKIMSFVGLVKAPGYLTHTDMENRIFDLYNIRNTGTKPHQEEEANKTKAKIRSLYREGNMQDAQDLMQESMKAGLLRPSQLKTLLRSAGNVSNPSVYFFKTLPFEDKQALYKDMTDEEKKLYDSTGSVGRQIEAAEKSKE